MQKSSPLNPEDSLKSNDRRYFFEITDTADFVRMNATPVGITRVTLAIIKALAEKRGPESVYMCAKDRKTGDFVAMDTKRLIEVPNFDSASMRYALGMIETPELDSPPTLEKYENQPLKSAFHLASRHYRAWRGNDAYFRRRGSSLEQWEKYFSSKRELNSNGSPRSTFPSIKKTPIEELARPGDELCLPGAQWERQDLHAVFEDLHHRGVLISLIVYDLIAIYRPDLSVPDLPPRFLGWLERAANYADRYVAISEHTAYEIRDFLSERGLVKPITVVPLALEMPASEGAGKNASIPSRARVSEYAKVGQNVHAASSRPFVLCVGTMEIRKNNFGLAQAWARLVQDPEVDPPCLVFAGKQGWNNDLFLDWMKRSGGLGGWIHLVDSPSDDELKFLYRRCEFTAMVSFAEGWGLPIGESLSYGKTAVVAHNTAMPEVGGDMVEYCDAKSVQSIAAACRKLIDDNGRRTELEERIKTMRLRTWDDVLRDFIEALERPKAQPTQD